MNKYEERIRDELVLFYEGKENQLSEEAISVAASGKMEWDDDNDEEMEQFLDEKVSEILDLERPWKNNFVFSYEKKGHPVLQDGWAHEGYDSEGNFVEYDGTIVNAPDENTAWNIFVSMDGKFGLPDASDYSCRRVYG